ncbi:hypothetical protein ABZW18_18470 [Streptomyces sp. NPDC004647]|uniref:hypothetical protein n=1 Tax=Streptomyces sp. NPDC004647 TaxID=3154671 RepID=UPI0033A55D14
MLAQFATLSEEVIRGALAEAARGYDHATCADPTTVRARAACAHRTLWRDAGRSLVPERGRQLRGCCRVWQNVARARARAREYALTRTELASDLAKRPDDLRHAGISFWLHSGVDPAECARRAGQSIEVLFRHYAKFLNGIQEHANRLIEQSMQEWDRVSQDVEPAG